MSKHTPGPWRVYNGWVHPSFDNLGRQMTNGDTAICEPLGQDKNANAYLIAAAPDLLAGLEQAVWMLYGIGISPESEAMESFTAAIRKAKGLE